jgi:hypothetical protein
MAATNKQEAEVEARKIVSDWVKGAVLTGWIPGSALLLTGADFVMLEQIARIYGVDAFDKEAAMQSIGTIAASGVTGGVIGEAVGLVPVFGWAVKSGLMGMKARYIGDAIITYFSELSPLPATPSDAGTPAPPPPSTPPAEKPRVQLDDDETA